MAPLKKNNEPALGRSDKATPAGHKSNSRTVVRFPSAALSAWDLLVVHAWFFSISGLWLMEGTGFRWVWGSSTEQPPILGSNHVDAYFITVGTGRSDSCIGVRFHTRTTVRSHGVKINAENLTREETHRKSYRESGDI